MDNRCKPFLGALLFAALCGNFALDANEPPNSIRIAASSEARSPQPITISRIFARGEIGQFAQAVIDGKPLESQCDVKTRWPDGSLQHALVSFWFTPSTDGVEVEFVNQTISDTAGGLTREQMLEFNGSSWGGAISASARGVSGERLAMTVDSRRIVEEWDGQPADGGVRYWLRGPVCTQVIVEDRSPGLKYDFGWEATQGAVRLAANITSDQLTIPVFPDDLQDLASWEFPLTVSIDAEQIDVCSLVGEGLSVCENGRGANWTKAARHSSDKARKPIRPNFGWRFAPEDRFRSLHPVFVLTFYPGYPGVRVEAILENVWTNRLQDQAFELQLLADNPPESVGVPEQLVQVAQTRWRRTFWSGAQPAVVHIDYNAPYLIHSRVVPNYDLSNTISETAINADINSFMRGDRTAAMGRGPWVRYFPTTGNRGDTGLLAAWYVRYLYTFDSRLEGLFRAAGEVSGHVPIHLREGDLGRFFSDLDGEQVPAFGRVVTPYSRPTLNTRAPSLRADALIPVGQTTTGGWTVDRAHQPDFAFLPYVLTGDWYFLEELSFWAGFNITAGNPDNCGDWCRHGVWGYLNDQLRGEAWSLRSLGRAAFAAVDGSPEKKLFLKMLDTNLAVREGELNVKNGFFHSQCTSVPYDPQQETSPWCWGRYSVAKGLDNPLNYLDLGGSNSDGHCGPTLDPAKCATANAPWQYNYMHTVLGHLEELGLQQVSAYRRAAAKHLLHQVLDPDYNPYLVSAYRMPVRTTAEGRPHFETWEAVKGAFINPNVSAFEERYYLSVALAAASYLAGIDHGHLDGRQAWEWLHNADPGRGESTGDPKWKILPRETLPRTGLRYRRPRSPAPRPPAGSSR